MGAPAMLAPEALEGYGGTGFDIAALFEPLGRALCPEPLLGQAMGLAALAACGAQAAQAVAGTEKLALAWSEPDMPYGRDGLTTRATQAQGDGWRLTGRKSVVYGGHCADRILVVAVHAGGVGLFAIRAADAERIPYGMVDGGGAAELFLDGTPAEALTRQATCALDAAEGAGLVALVWEAVGVADRLVEITADYLRTRSQFGRPIGSFQALQHRAVEMAVALTQMRSIAIRAAASLGTPTQARHAAMAKSLIGRSGRMIAQEAIQLHGGIAMTWEAEVSHYAKRLVMIDAQLGDADWHTEQLAAAL
jgi:alkylation response protein AidB-like acyl-CoA dehydrogenase